MDSIEKIELKQPHYLPFFEKWLNNQPLPEEVKLNDDGSEYIPIEYIKPKLDYLSPTWGTKNFHQCYTEMPVFNDIGTKIGSTLIASFSAELDLFINEEKQKPLSGEFFTVEEIIIHRTITGCATFDVQKYYPNTNWAQTGLSLCIVAAAKELGHIFGKELNKGQLAMPTNSKPAKKPNKILNTLKSLTQK